MGCTVAADLELQIWGVVGASGTGKGLWIKRELKRLNPRRLVIWDFKKEYDGWGNITSSLREVRAAMIKAGDGPLRIRYLTQAAKQQDMQAEFQVLCELVYAWQHCVFLAEELANVTTPSWAPASWRKMTTSGRHEGIHIIGATQTPALVDKTFLGNCTLLHCCALREANHRKAIARSMDITEAEVASLVKLEYIEKDFNSGAHTRGFVAIPGQKATARPKTAPPPAADEAPSPRRAKRSPSDSRTPSRRATSAR